MAIDISRAPSDDPPADPAPGLIDPRSDPIGPEGFRPIAPELSEADGQPDPVPEISPTPDPDPDAPGLVDPRPLPGDPDAP